MRHRCLLWLLMPSWLIWGAQRFTVDTVDWSRRLEFAHFSNYRTDSHKLNCMAVQTLRSTMSHLMPLRLLAGARCLLFSPIPRRPGMSLLSPMTALHFSMVRHYHFHTPYSSLARMFNPNHIYQAWCPLFSIMNRLTGITGAYIKLLVCWS